MIVTPTGSSITNAMFMQPNTLALLVFATWPDYYALLSCLTAHVHVVVCLDGGVNHFKPKAKWYVKQNLFLESVNISIDILKSIK